MIKVPHQLYLNLGNLAPWEHIDINNTHTHTHTHTYTHTGEEEKGDRQRKMRLAKILT